MALAVAPMLVALARAPIAFCGTPGAVEVYGDGVRFDLDTGALLDPGGLVGATELALAKRPIVLRAARDEVVAFQVLLRGIPPTSRATHLATQAPEDFGSPQGVRLIGMFDTRGSASSIRSEIFQERGVRVVTPSRAGGYISSLGPGYYPDALIPTSTIRLPEAPRVALLWIDLWIPPGVAPGRYHGVLEISGAPVVDVALEVLPLVLPARDVAALGGVSFGSFLERERREPGSMRAWMQLAHAHQFTVQVMHARPEIRADATIDWEKWAAWVGPYVDGSAFESSMGYAGPRVGQPVAWWILPHSDVWPTPKGDSERGWPADPEAWARSLAAWESIAKNRGWFDVGGATKWVLFVNSLDEPKTERALTLLAAYGPLLDRANLQDRRHVWFRTDGPFGQRVKGWPDERILRELGGAVDIWNVCGGSEWSPWTLLDARRQAHTEELLMFYASNTAGEPAAPPLVLDAAITGARAWGWIAFRYGLAGALNWEVDFRSGCVENPLCSDAGLNLDALLIYRGHELGLRQDVPIASMRLKSLRRGAQDAALLALLEEKDPKMARLIAAAMIPEALGDSHPSRGHGAWPKDPRALERARALVLDLIAGRPPSLSIEALRSGPSGTFGFLSLGFFGLVGVGLLGLLFLFGISRFVRSVAQRDRS